MFAAWGDVLRPPHCTTPAAVKANKNIKVRSIKSNEHNRKKVDGPYLEVLAKKSLISERVMTLQRKPEENMLQFSEFQIGSRSKD